jgi:tRNA(Ile)-lysidine synthase
MKRIIGILNNFIEVNFPVLPVTVGVSGGADSLALILVLSKVVGPGNVIGLIVNHNASAESGAIATNTAEILQKFGISSKIVNVTPGNNPNEFELRELRYQAFSDNCSEIFLAHTMNDQAEQVLLGLLRGSGTKSLKGMLQVSRINVTRPEIATACSLSSPPRNDESSNSSSISQHNKTLGIYRPFLYDITRKDTEVICRELGVDYYIDPMSSKRGDIRHNVIPELSLQLGRDIIPNLVQTSKILAEDDLYFDTLVKNLFQENGVYDIYTLEQTPVPIRKRLYLQTMKWLTNDITLEFNSKHLEEIDKLVTGYNGQKPLNLPRCTVERVKSNLIFKLN